LVIKYLFIGLGLLFVGLGFIGIVIPGIPTTPFLLGYYKTLEVRAISMQEHL